MSLFPFLAQGGKQQKDVFSFLVPSTPRIWIKE